MNVSPSEAEEALTVIQAMVKKTRHSIASSGAHISLIVTGVVWFIGFISTQFLPQEILVYIWIGISVIGSSLASLLGARSGRRVRSPSTGTLTKQIILIWMLLAVYCGAAIIIAWPLNGMQVTIFVVLFVMMGYLAMGLILSIISVWSGLIIIALMLAGYFLLPQFFYLWMALLGGGGMVGLGLYIRYRW